MLNPSLAARDLIWSNAIICCILAIENLICGNCASEMLQDVEISPALHTSGRIIASPELQLPRGDETTARLHRQWLQDVANVTRKPLTRLAKDINISPSTLTRPVSEGEHGTSTLHARTIAKIVAYTGVGPPKAVTGPHSGRPLGAGDDAVPYTADDTDPVSLAIRALIAGRNSVSAFVVRSHALELAGFLPGDVVLLDRNATPAPDDLVMAEVLGWPPAKAGTVLRMLRRADPVDLLVARSVDHAFHPIVVGRERVVIKGVVLPHRLRATAGA